MLLVLLGKVYSQSITERRQVLEITKRYNELYFVFKKVPGSSVLGRDTIERLKEE